MGMQRYPTGQGGQPAKGYSRPLFKPVSPEALTSSGPSRVAALVLAAGRGSRFGGDAPKPLARLGRRTLLAHAVAAASASGLRPVVVVVGYRGEEVAAAAGTLAEIVENPDWEEGMAASLRAGLAAVLPDPTISAVAVALADQPRVGPEAYRRLSTAHRAGADLAVATYDGERGHPVLIGRSHWAEAMKLTGDEGARALLADHPVESVACDDTGAAVDIDTPADLEALEAVPPA
jgi:molybdenum cofactor cytidylyltransferase